MLISLKKEIAFLANPKCGTTSIEKALANKCEIKMTSTKYFKHTNAYTFQKKWKPFLASQLGIKNLLTICTTREPTSKIISRYKYRSRSQLKGEKRYLGDTPFREFCSQQMQLQSDAFFFDADTKKLLIDIVVPIENIEILENFLSKEFEVESIPRINTSTRAHPTSLAARMNNNSYQEVIEDELKKASTIFTESVQRSKLIANFFSSREKLDDLRDIPSMLQGILAENN